jgi:hypothetical protein
MCETFLVAITISLLLIQKEICGVLEAISTGSSHRRGTNTLNNLLKSIQIKLDNYLRYTAYLNARLCKQPNKNSFFAADTHIIVIIVKYAEEPL